MTLIDFGDFKLRFDAKEVRISIDGEIVDIGARRSVTNEELEDNKLYYNHQDGRTLTGKQIKKEKKSTQK